jgi:hypothetical protein
MKGKDCSYVKRMADGGPVSRRPGDPIVGTRAPVRTGTSAGALSPAAVSDAIKASAPPRTAALEPTASSLLGVRNTGISANTAAAMKREGLAKGGPVKGFVPFGKSTSPAKTKGKRTITSSLPPAPKGARVDITKSGVLKKYKGGSIKLQGGGGIGDDDFASLSKGLKAASRKHDPENYAMLAGAKDKPSREMAQAMKVSRAADTDVTTAGRRISSATGKPYGPQLVETESGIGGGNKVDEPMQPVGTEKGRITARNVAAVAKPIPASKAKLEYAKGGAVKLASGGAAGPANAYKRLAAESIKKGPSKAKFAQGGIVKMADGGAPPASDANVGLWERLKAGNIDDPSSEAYRRWGKGKDAAAYAALEDAAATPAAPTVPAAPGRPVAPSDAELAATNQLMGPAIGGAPQAGPDRPTPRPAAATKPRLSTEAKSAKPSPRRKANYSNEGRSSLPPPAAAIPPPVTPPVAAVPPAAAPLPEIKLPPTMPSGRPWREPAPTGIAPIDTSGVPPGPLLEIKLPPGGGMPAPAAAAVPPTGVPGMARTPPMMNPRPPRGPQAVDQGLAPPIPSGQPLPEVRLPPTMPSGRPWREGGMDAAGLVAERKRRMLAGLPPFPGDDKRLAKGGAVSRFAKGGIVNTPKLPSPVTLPKPGAMPKGASPKLGAAGKAEQTKMATFAPTKPTMPKPRLENPVSTPFGSQHAEALGTSSPVIGRPARKKFI